MTPRALSRSRVLQLAASAALAASLGACAPPPPPPQLPNAEPPPPSGPSAKVGWPYWRAPPLDLRPVRRPAEPPPDAPAWLTGDASWRFAAGAIMEKLRDQGVALRRPKSAEIGVGTFYEDRGRRGATLVLTADALFALVHVAFAAVAADLEDRVLRTDLSTILARLDARLHLEAIRARPDLLAAYRVARGTVAVALALMDPAYVAPIELEDVVSAEKALVRAHAGVSRSPLFEGPVDYGAMTPRGAVSAPADPRAARFQAAAWLAGAPFAFDGEGPRARVDVGAARAQARAALLIARLLYKGGDGAAHVAASRMADIDRFVLGDSDDLSPLDVAELAGRSGIDLQGGADIAATTALDHFRHAVTSGLSAGVARDGGAPDSTRAARTMRVLPLRSPPDNRALAALLFPSVGLRVGGDAGLGRERRTPSALDIGAWLGSASAASALTARGDVDYEGFGRALSVALGDRRGDEATLHASVYRSLLDAQATWLRPSAVAADGRPSGDAEGRRKLRTALAAWTFLRHDALAFAHDPARALASRASDPETARVLVEPHPEAIASLLGAVQQLRRGLEDLGDLDGAAPAEAILAETEGVLAVALDAAVAGANGDRAADSRQAELAQIPARIAAIEGATHPLAEPVVVDVHVDPASGRVLEEGTGPLEEVFMWVRDPRSSALTLAVGASVPHLEFIEPRGRRLGDAAWEARIAAGLVPSADPSEPEPIPPG